MKLSTLFVAQSATTATRIASLGYESVQWDALTDEQAKSSDLVLVPEPGDDDGVRAGKEIAARMKVEEIPVSIRRLKYSDEDGIPQSLSIEGEYVARDMLNQCLRDKPWYQRRRRLIEMGVGRFAAEPEEQQWVAGRLLPASVPMLIAGRGGIGKTTTAMHLALLMASWDGKGAAPVWMGQTLQTHGVTVVITYEEPTKNIHRILHEMCEAEGLDPAVVDTRCIVKSMQDVDATAQPLVAPDPKTREPNATAEYHALTEELRELERHVGSIGCIVIDNLGTAYSVNGNDYQEANQAMKFIQRWSAEFGALILNIGHTNKGATPQRGRDGEVPPPLSDDEVLNTVMGSTGWISAHRAALVMWQMDEQAEAKLARDLDDKTYVPGETRRRYVHAQVLKENVRGIYTGRLTLHRNGVAMVDISKGAKRASSGSFQRLMADLSVAISKAETQGFTFLPTGKRGVFANRDALGEPFSRMKRAQIEKLAKEALDNGVIEFRKDGAGKDYLAGVVGDGKLRKHRELVARAVEVAHERGKPFAFDAMDPAGVVSRRDELPNILADLSDDDLNATMRLTLMYGDIGRADNVLTAKS